MFAGWSRPPRLLLSLFALLLLTPAPAARASSALAMNSLELQLRSDAIVAGRVVGLRTHRLERGLIVTDVKFLVEQTARGTGLPATITVRQPGGRIGDELQVADEVPTFELNEQALLFLRENRAGGFYSVVGLEQGKVSLVPEAGGRLRLERRMGGVAQSGLAQTLRPGARWDYLDDFMGQPEVDPQ